ncbi:MAG: PhzF family phenazine biosynthesis protein [Candidatus Omnitrophica bacterium]|nr:PhzF family phenazine biosynthesis protein [Candidatus Omnitrophota bacterium]
MSDGKIYFLRAFTTDRGEGGNAAAVVLDAEDIAPVRRQAIAARAAVSETAFVSKGHRDNLWTLDFYTPTKPIAHCGHATVAAFSLMTQIGRIPGGQNLFMQAAAGGEFAVKSTADGRVFLRLPPAAYESVDSGWLEEVLRAMGFHGGASALAREPVIADCANRFLLLPLSGRPVLAALEPRFDALARLGRQKKLVGFYPFYRVQDGAEGHAEARLFAPDFGIEEESATGTAAAPLACWLASQNAGPEPRGPWILRQGALMRVPSPSRIEAAVETEAGRIEHVWVGGFARVQNEPRPETAP